LNVPYTGFSKGRLYVMVKI